MQKKNILIAKLYYSENVDYVMTFEELVSILDSMEINLEQTAPFHIDKVTAKVYNKELAKMATERKIKTLSYKQKTL